MVASKKCIKLQIFHDSQESLGIIDIEVIWKTSSFQIYKFPSLLHPKRVETDLVMKLSATIKNILITIKGSMNSYKFLILCNGMVKRFYNQDYLPRILSSKKQFIIVLESLLKLLMEEKIEVVSPCDYMLRLTQINSILTNNT